MKLTEIRRGEMAWFRKLVAMPDTIRRYRYRYIYSTRV